MKRNRLLLPIVLYSLVFGSVWAQPASPPPKDAVDQEEEPKLPFYISKQKRLLDRDLKNKKEGWFPTGLPLVNYGPIQGVGYGARVYLYENKTRKDPFFAYTPYRTRIFAQYFATTKGSQYHMLSLDSPFIFDTKWRLRMNFIYNDNPNALFYGIGTSSLQPLSYQYHNDPSQARMANATWTDYWTNSSYAGPGSTGTPLYLGNHLYNGIGSPYQTATRYNYYHLIQPTWNMNMEHNFFGGTVRAVISLRVSKATIQTYDGRFSKEKVPVFGTSPSALVTANLSPVMQRAIMDAGHQTNVYANIPVPNGTTKLTQAAQAGQIRGFNGGWVNTVRASLLYDTRDLEPDPNRGMFIEGTVEKSTRLLGSAYDYYKVFGQARVYYSPLPDLMKKVPKRFEKLVIAARVAYGETQGQAPFFEYRNMWSSLGTITGLGGLRTLRGYKQDRFVGPAMGWGNFEVRWKFAETRIGSQHFAFNLVPFVDVGRVWNTPSKVGLTKFKYDRGLGLRIAWNQSTIIMIDYAKSQEDSQLFVNFNHIF